MPQAQSCSVCGAALSGKFCSACGASAELARCASCGNQISPAARFCPQCGSPAGRALTPRRDRTPWLIAGGAVAALMATLLIMGFAATEHGVSILARASQKQVVNVAQRGGLAAVLVSRTAPVIAAPATALDLHLTWGKL